MRISTIKHVVITVFCIALSHSTYSADELYDSELSGLAYINIPFSGNKGHSSPTFSFVLRRHQQLTSPPVLQIIPVSF